LLAESFETHKPATGEDSAIVTDAVLARWYLWRRQRAHSRREAELYSKNNQPDSIYADALRGLALYDHYRVQAERTLANVRNLKKEALNTEKWRAQLERQKARHELDLQRFELRRAQDAVSLPKSPPKRLSPPIMPKAISLASKQWRRPICAPPPHLA
jgi:hypothetical protein